MNTLCTGDRLPDPDSSAAQQKGIREAMEIDLEDNVVILDEAHNIEEAARDAGSCEVEDGMLLGPSLPPWPGCRSLGDAVTDGANCRPPRVPHRVARAAVAWQRGRRVGQPRRLPRPPLCASVAHTCALARPPLARPVSLARRTRPGSHTRTRCPVAAADTAAINPAGPAPITRTSGASLGMSAIVAGEGSCVSGKNDFGKSDAMSGTR